MFTDYTYQMWQQEPNKAKAVKEAVTAYRESYGFTFGLTANEYKAGRNPVIAEKVLIRKQAMLDKNGDLQTINSDVVGNRISSNFFFRFVMQQNQYLLGYGADLGDDKKKELLGEDFDYSLQRCGEMALAQGVSYGFWNLKELQPIEAATDLNTGFCPLLDEMTGDLLAGIQFWQVNKDRPIYYRSFEADGMTEYEQKNESAEVKEKTPKAPYKRTVRKDALGERQTKGENYAKLPIIPFYANAQCVSELSESLKSKIDMYDTIMSDLADNFERSNDVYWVLNHFNGTANEIVNTLSMLEKLRIAITPPPEVGASGSGGPSAEPHTIEVPYLARLETMAALRKEMYADYMALDMEALTGDTLTNVAIKAATKNLDLKADMYEYQVGRFCKAVFALVGIETDKLTFRRNRIENEVEQVDSNLKIAQTVALMRSDISLKAALQMFADAGLIDEDTIDEIVKDKDTEDLTGLTTLEGLQRQISELQNGGAQ